MDCKRRTVIEFKNMKLLFFDTETTGLPPKNARYDLNYDLFPHIVQLAWHFDDEYYNFIIKPEGWIIPDNMIHGITQEYALKNGKDFDYVIMLFLNHCYEAEKIIAHNIYFDTSVIKANVIRLGDDHIFNLTEQALHKSKRIDTMMKTIKFVGARNANGGCKFPTLEELHEKIFNQSFNAHNAKNDVEALKRCFDALTSIGII